MKLFGPVVSPSRAEERPPELRFFLARRGRAYHEGSKAKATVPFRCGPSWAAAGGPHGGASLLVDAPWGLSGHVRGTRRPRCWGERRLVWRAGTSDVWALGLWCHRGRDEEVPSERLLLQCLLARPADDQRTPKITMPLALGRPRKRLQAGDWAHSG